ncbi:Vacuolar protein sorting-associated protein 13D [Blomia tropicalis]|nr:Vacuolar protein sorting-associated protein 13D [Blomia tropicalis]
MLESFAAWILNTYIGDYFGNVNTDQLRMSLHSGEIELERLPLKRDLLKHLGLPLEANTGYIGKISIKFPRWHLFTSEPLVITVEELYLLVKPITNFTYNEEEENRAQHEFKLSQLDMLESRWKALHDDLTEQSSYYSSSYSSWLNYGSSFFTNILLNVHLKIGSVHIRYEDQTTIPGCPFATGVVIRSLSVCSTDENWEPKYVTRDNLSDRNLLFKMIELESFSVYFDTDTTLFNSSSINDRQQLQSLVELMRNNLEQNQNRFGDSVEHCYIIAPVNGKCYLKRNSSEMSLKSCKQPRTVIDVQLEQVPIMMTAIQYKHLLDWSLSFQTSKTLWRYRKWRPMILKKQRLKQSRSRSRTESSDIGDVPDPEVLEDEEDNVEDGEYSRERTPLNDRNCRIGFEPKIWWHFAINANLEEYRQRRQRFNWHFILQRSRDIVAYHQAYLHYLIYPELFTKEMRYLKDRVENELSLDEICSIREIVFNESDRILKEQNRQQQKTNSDQNQMISYEQQQQQQEIQQQAQGQTSSWFLPYIISGLYYNNTITPETPSEEATSQQSEMDLTTQTPVRPFHRRTLSTSSTSSLTEDIFLLRDAVFCQFNFRIRNSSFQLIAFNSDQTNDESATASSASSGNLLLEFEFTKMKIGVEITNPNAYSCVCHMNQRYRRRQMAANVNTQPTNILENMSSSAKIIPQKFLTQNELNMLQFNLNFECHNLNLTLLRTDQLIISDNDSQKLATAQLTGGAMAFVFSQSFISIDGKLDSLEVLDLVTQPKVNKHRRVLSIGQKQVNPNQSFDGEITGIDTDQSITGIDSDAYRLLQQSDLEKAFSFSLSRQFVENMLRLNIEMASFSYVHSAVLVHELNLCRECFSDVLEAYFSRSFKERVKAATTEMLRGIVNKSGNDSTNESKDSSSINVGSAGSQTNSPLFRANNNRFGVGSAKSRTTRKQSSNKSQQISPFVDNFKLNIFIRSPVIIFPIVPSSHEVVVFHLGHMLLNNHNQSTDIVVSNTKMSNGYVPTKKYSPNSNQPNPTSSSSSSTSHSYNAEIRDLSVYMLDCTKNIEQFNQSQIENNDPTEMTMQQIYFIDSFGVPILQKTVIEIILEKKVLMFSLEGSVSQKRPLSSRLSTSTQPVQLPNSGKTSTSSISSQDDSILVDGLNLISTVNSIDPFRPPKKFSIRSHFYPEPNSGVGDYYKTKIDYKNNGPKPELVLSVEVSSIDVRLSYNDLLVFMHIVNTLMPDKSTITETSESDLNSTNNNNNSRKDISNVTKTGDNDDQETPNMVELAELFSKEFRRKSRRDSSLNLKRSKSSENVHESDNEQNQSIKLSELNPNEFKLRLDKLQDLGFEYGESLRALAMTGGDVIEAAFMLSSNEGLEHQTIQVSGQSSHHQQKTKPIDATSDPGGILSSDENDNHSQSTFSTERSNSLHQLSTVANSSVSNNSTSGGGGGMTRNRSATKNRSTSNSLLSSLSVIEIRITNGSVRIIDDCNQLDIPLLELGVREFRLLQQQTSPVIEAYAQTNFYCDYYNSHLSGWEPMVEHCQVQFSWKMHQQRCHLKSMLANPIHGGIGSGVVRPQTSKRKLALKIEIKKMFNLNISRTLLDLIDKVRTTWIQDISDFVSMPVTSRSFRHRQPFIPFALKNETGSDVQLLLPANTGRSISFATGKAADLITHCDLCQTIETKAGQIVCFDLIDVLGQKSQQQLQRWSRRSGKTSSVPQKILVKVDGWSATFPVSIEREGTFIRHIVSERYFNQSAILVFEIVLQSSAIKLITVRSSLQVSNRTTKNVELDFVNTAMSDVRTSYIIAPNGLFPVPLKLLYARMQLRPCDLGLGSCRTPINWTHVRKYGEQHCSLQICTPITHTSQASYSNSSPYVVTVLVERNSIGALIESRKMMLSSPISTIPTTNGITNQTPFITTIPSHTITLLPPLQLANRLPYELRFMILNSTTTGTIRSGEDYSVHYISPLETFIVEFSMEHFPKSKPLIITPGATKDYSTYIDIYDTNGRLLVLHASISVISGSQQPCNAMTITIYSPHWIINRSGLPLIFAQEGVYTESAGQSTEHERARSISPLLFSYAEVEAPKYCIMRLGRMTDGVEPRWCNFFLLEKGTFYRRLRVTECLSRSVSMNSFDPITMSPGKAGQHYFQQPATEKIYEFGIDIRNGRDRYSHTKIVTIAPRYQIENLTSYKLEFAQRCMVESSLTQSSGTNDFIANSPVRSSSLKSSHQNYNNYHRSSIDCQQIMPTVMSSATSVISALPKSNMPFHWPATDMPKLLCVRIASFVGCLWSGSFSVGNEPSVSFHLNIRDDSGRSYFIRVEILLQNATYFIVFTDANSLPPPIRVENFSQVPIEFYQSRTTNMLQRTRVRPNSSVPYALDEPTLPSHVTVCAPGGACSTYDLNSFAPGDNLTYDNFYYIAFEETFLSANAAGTFSSATFNVGGSYIADLDDDEQVMLMMLAGPDFSGLEPDSSVNSQMLVLDVPDEIDAFGPDSTKPVVLARKERGKRSQLWRIDMHNRIIHEGSSPPLEPGIDLGFAEIKLNSRHRQDQYSSLLVLDIADQLPPNANGSIPLIIRKLNHERTQTQTWQFTEDGRLRCAKHEHLFVQPNSFDSDNTVVFRSGTPACLLPGPLTSQTIIGSTEALSIPKAQAIMKQKMRKGSGVLNVSIMADGPSRVLRIKDQQMSANGRHLHLIQHYSYGSPITLGQFGVERSHHETSSAESFLVRMLKQTELELNLHIDSIGISVISKRNEELVYLFVQRILLETILNPTECRLHCMAQNFQVDNQLRNCEKEIVLQVGNLPESSTPNLPNVGQSSIQLVNGNSQQQYPAITFNAHKLFIPNVETNVFKSLQVSINDLIVNIEELLLLKLLEFINYDPVDSEMDEISSAHAGGVSNTNSDLMYHANRNVSSSLARSVQYYFAYLLVQLSQVKLSVFTSRVSSYLSDLKKKAGIKLIRFEDALIQLRPFHKVYSLMTRRFLQDSIKEHYRSELRSQAAKILGTVDFLGNPVGFLNDMADGFSELFEGNLSGWIMNVTHGISDSTAKFTSVLSESLGSVTMDNRYQEIRRNIKQQSAIGGQRSHLSAGVLGLAHGVFGGITSLITQTYDGAVTVGGVTGLLSGFGKGILGTFAKPAVGMLDFASSAATAVRDSSRKATYSANGPANRIRLPRTLTIDGLVTTYDAIQATWQTRFYNTNDFGTREFGEQFVHVFILADQHFLLLTTERLFFFHSTLKRNDLPDPFELLHEDQLEFPEQFGSKITNCSILQLQILALEQFNQAVHYQMIARDAQRFVRLHGAQQTCLDFSSLPKESLCNFVELRCPTMNSGNSPQHSKYQSYINDQSSRSKRSTSMPATARLNRMSSDEDQPLITVTGIEYPKLLNLCYVYCDQVSTIEKLVSLVNEAKHLQEERKFEVANVDSTK